MSIFDRALDRATRFVGDVLLLPDDAREQMDAGEKALTEGKAKEAERLFRAVLEARPGLLRAQIGWGRALAASGDLSGAKIAVAEARLKEPDDPALALLSARLSLEDGDTVAAITSAREAARRLAAAGGAPFAEACAIRGRAEWRRGRADRGVRELKKAIAASPDEIEYRIELAEALADSGDLPAAARAARGVPEAQIDEARARRLGLALRRAGDAKNARPLLERAAKAGDVGALVALAEDASRGGSATTAEAHARMAVARGGGASALVALAEVLERQARFAEAAQALLAAAAMNERDLSLLLRAGRTVPLRDAREVGPIADVLDRRAPGSALGRAIRAHELALRGDVPGARALSDPGTDGGDEPRLGLARARIAVLEDDPTRAIVELDALLSATVAPRPADAELAATLRKSALRALYVGEGDEVDLAAAIDGVLALGKDGPLAAMEPRARALRDELDRPLLLAVLGEFNAGKSTLVNAFVGADVAPTGILPTTATLNVLRGGAERRVRVVRKNGTTREGTYDELRALLAAAESEGASVDHVEIVLPSDLLERVWILDTPGSNAPDPDHERLAAEAMRRADAALWIFDAGQAGKATEGAILAAVRKSRREVLGAINKIDRLKPADVQVVKDALVAALPEIGGDPVALSARAALRARLANDDAAYEASGFPALLARLEKDVFSRSRQLKRRACAGRLLELLEEARGTEGPQADSAEAHAAELEKARRALARLWSDVQEDVDRTMADLEAGQETAFADAAREVLSFVRPRTNRFAAHGTDPEDRAFLAEAIQHRLELASEGAAERLETALGVRLGPALAGTTMTSELALEVRAAVSPPIAAFAGYQAGLLSGGALRRFFDEVLPHAELSPTPIAEALSHARAAPREMLRPALEACLTDLARRLDTTLEQRAVAIRRAHEAMRARVYEPLAVLHDVLRELVDARA